MLQLDAAQVAARLDRLSLIDTLEDAFRTDFHAPHREHHTVGDHNNVLLIMPAWQSGGCMGVKLVTIFPPLTPCSTAPPASRWRRWTVPNSHAEEPPPPQPWRPATWPGRTPAVS
jgi:hypothetical protein